MNFTLVIQMKGSVIRVIADNNPGLHRRSSGFQPAPPVTSPVLTLTERGSEAFPAVRHDYDSL